MNELYPSSNARHPRRKRKPDKPGFGWLLVLLAAWMLVVPARGFGQKPRGTVSGTVLDADGNSIVGVAVSIVGTARGRVTDSQGMYTLEDVAEGETLRFAFVGYITEERIVRFGGKSALSLNAILMEDTQGIDAVEVVAFGVQKKESVIGSITTVTSKDLKTPSSNLTNALAGRVAGMISYQRSGEPGADDASFFIRGVTSFNDNTNPLILIDNVELTTTDLARLQPDEIESFTVMKDATATALYGARGANGVILVKTKSGVKGKAVLTVRIENSFSMPTKELELADPVTYMRLHNEALLTRNPLAMRLYSDDKINNTVPGRGSVLYPATDWKKELLKDFSTNQRFNLSLSGGGDKARYYVAASFSNENGIVKNAGGNNFNNNISNKNYTLRSNTNIELTRSTEMIVRLSGTFTDYSGPLTGGTDLYKMIMKSNPVLFPATYPKTGDLSVLPYIVFGNYEDGSGSYYLNPYAEAVRGYRERGRANMTAQFEIKQELDFITEGLSARALVNVLRISNYEVSRSYTPAYYYLNSHDPLTGEYTVAPKDPEGTNFGILNYDPSSKDVQSSTYFEGAVNYSRDFGRHGVSGLLVFQMTNQLQPNKTDILLSLPKRNMGLSGRATYAYDKRYFAEFNFGYNGSERFSRQNRWGFFPSAGLAWVISNEKFFGTWKNFLHNFKLRFSYGIVGNDNLTGNDLDRFFFLSNVNMSSNKTFHFGEDPNARYSVKGVDVLRYANPGINWEKSYKTNIALEIGIRNNLNLTVEYYRERREQIYQQRANIPKTMGLAANVFANIGEARGQGVDVALDYNKIFTGGAWLQVKGNFTYAASKYTEFEERSYDEYWRTRVGYSIKQSFGYIAESLFVDEEEVANTPHLSDAMAGDIKYRDVNGDGLIDDADKVPIGYPTVPEIVYGIGASFGYKGFDCSFFFQGSARESFFIDYTANSPFRNLGVTGSSFKTNNQLADFIARSYWSEENQNIYAVWPRLTTIENNNNNQISTWWMRNSSFLRLKQVEIGYTLPRELTRRWGMQSVRFYVSGTNLLCFSSFKLWDPELGSNALNYPLQRVFNLGINLVF